MNTPDEAPLTPEAGEEALRAYLFHFMDPRVITENTMRRGFAPPEVT